MISLDYVNIQMIILLYHTFLTLPALCSLLYLTSYYHTIPYLSFLTLCIPCLIMLSLTFSFLTQPYLYLAFLSCLTKHPALSYHYFRLSYYLTITLHYRNLQIQYNYLTFLLYALCYLVPPFRYLNVVPTIQLLMTVQDLVEWYTAIRSAKLNRLAIAYPGTTMEEVAWFCIISLSHLTY